MVMERSTGEKTENLCIPPHFLKPFSGSDWSVARLILAPGPYVDTPALKPES